MSICFNIRYMIFKKVAPKCSNESILLFGKNYLFSRLNLEYYLKLCNNFENLLPILFDNHQLSLFNFENKPNLFIETTRTNKDYVEPSSLDLIKYFSKKNEDNLLTSIDERLITNSNIIIKKYLKK